MVERADCQPAALRGQGRKGPRPSELPDELEASGPVIVVPPSHQGCLSGKGRWGWHSRFLSRSPSPSTVTLPGTSGPSVCPCPFWNNTGSHIFLWGVKVGKAKSFLSGSGKEDCGELVREWAGLAWQAALSQPCPCRPLGHPNSAHRPRSPLGCCGTPISARTLFSPRNVTRARSCPKCR